MRLERIQSHNPTNSRIKHIKSDSHILHRITHSGSWHQISEFQEFSKKAEERLHFLFAANFPKGGGSGSCFF
jgi:ribosome biogenesis protein Tsr3